MSTLPHSILSIDISKDYLDTDGWPTVWRRRIPNDTSGVASIVKRARQLKAFVIFEATSVYDRRLMAALEKAGLAYHRANPRKAREFAKAAGFLAKTDRVDAAMLAEYARRIPLAAAEPLAPERQALRSLIDRRNQLVTMRKQEATRLKQVDDAAIRAEMETFLIEISDRVAAYEQQIKVHLKTHPEHEHVARLLSSAPGVALVTAASLIAFLPELGRRSAKAITALVGLAPLSRDSGRWRGQRRIWGGRRKLRTLLFLAARHAAKHPAFAAFAKRLEDAGKQTKKVRIAVARKLLLALNAMISENRPFIEQSA
ncbi:IS110 family transposase [uncultured Roseibium sp.]|uniref:IS110 family transposase n=1 Tax=uncultured Roseibium sp. TaxID=1936171 RepID=UPI0032175E73